MSATTKVLIDILLLAMLLLVALLLAGMVSQLNPGCTTCGPIFAITFWAISASALQPVLWAKNISQRERWACWIAAIAVGYCAYYLMRSIATLLFAHGERTMALSLGLVIEIMGAGVAFLTGQYLIRRAPTIIVERSGGDDNPIAPWSQRSKLFRVYCFLSACWSFGALVCIWFFDPYEPWRYMDGDDRARVLFMVFGIPALVGVGIHVYRRYVR
jgi:hypothetical protein